MEIESDFLTEARRLAKLHVNEDPKTSSIWFDETSYKAGEVRLVEVTTDVRDTGAVFPFRFSPDPAGEHPFAICIVVMSPGDWQRLTKKKILAGWSHRDQLKALYVDGVWRE